MPNFSKAQFVRSALALFLVFVTIVSEAYIGPGAGISFLQGLWVALVGIILSLVAIVLLPFKLLLRQFGVKKAALMLIAPAAMVWLIYAYTPQSTPDEVSGRTIVLGFDGMDPQLVQRWMDDGLMPNFARLAESGSFQSLATTNPAQSPVAWSSFATGTGPGEHGIFDFLRRSTDSYVPDFSISETQATKYTIDMFGYKIPTEGGDIVNRRIGEPFWMTAENTGLNATILRVPVTYPPDPVFHMLSGMGVPDLLGSQGTYSIFTTQRLDATGNRRITRVIPNEKGLIETALGGPDDPFANGQSLAQPFTIKPAPRGIEININDNKFGLNQGQWSDWIGVHFEMMGYLRTSGLVRFLLVQSYPLLKLYVSPIHIDPYNPAIPISSPPGYAAELADNIGLFHTIGMPEESWSLNEEQISDEAFLEVIQTTLAEREAMWYAALEEHNTELVVAVFVQTDRVSHMFYRGLDENHPLFDKTTKTVRGAVRWIYQEADRVLGETLKRLDPEDKLIVLSDHGFAPFRKAVHLNRWLAKAGYLAFKPGEKGTDSLFEGVDWSKTRAYALGLNGIFINQRGREPSGSVAVLETKALKAKIVEQLTNIVDPETGDSLIREVYDREDIYPGLAIAEAPDLVIGYEKNYRASWQTTLGGTPQKLVEINLQKWSGDHCIDPSLVPGVLFTSFPFPIGTEKIQDVPDLILNLLEIQTND